MQEPKESEAHNIMAVRKGIERQVQELIEKNPGKFVFTSSTQKPNSYYQIMLQAATRLMAGEWEYELVISTTLRNGQFNESIYLRSTTKPYLSPDSGYRLDIESGPITDESLKKIELMTENMGESNDQSALQNIFQLIKIGSYDLNHPNGIRRYSDTYAESTIPAEEVLEVLKSTDKLLLPKEGTPTLANQLHSVRKN